MLLLSSLTLLTGSTLAVGADPPADGVYQAGDPGVASPRLIESTRKDPPYPDEARAAGIQGRVILRLLVDARGRVAQAKVLRAPYRGGDLAVLAVAAVQQWRYEPASLDGTAVPCWITASVGFYAGPSEPDPRRTSPQEVATEPARREQEPPESPPPVRPPEKDQPPVAGGRPEPAGEPDAAGSEAVSPPEDAPASAPAPSPAPAAEGRPPDEPGTVPAPPPAPPAGSAAEPTREPSPELGEPDAIDLGRGGPAGLILGADRDAAVRSLGGAATSRDDVGHTRLRSLPLGIEVTLARDRTGESIREIRYVFLDGWDGFAACRLHTESGLGRGSFCLGIPPAHGRPLGRTENIGPDGRTVVTLSYRLGATGIEFRCVEGRLAELLLRAEDAPAP